MGEIGLHNEPDVVLKAIGNLYMRDTTAIIGDLDFVRKFMAQAGVLSGGRQFGRLVMTFTKITEENVTSDPTVDAFMEPEP